MSENTAIEWATHTFNPWEGCTKVGPGCDHCYAETRNARYAGGEAINWGPGAPRRRTSVANWKKPIKWNKDHAAFFAQHGHRQRVFCASLADVFDNEVDPAWRRDLFDLIELTPNLDWLLLTKRIGNAFEMTSKARSHDWMAGQKNVWLGATVVNQTEAHRDIPKLLAMPAHRHFLSIEPMLGYIKIDQWGIRDIRYKDPRITTSQIDWVIVGGESGPAARPINPFWITSMRDQCKAHHVPFLFKQWGEFLPADADECDPGIDSSKLIWSDGNAWHESDGQCGGVSLMARVGKKQSGRLLDGITHDGFPIKY